MRNDPHRRQQIAASPRTDLLLGSKSKWKIIPVSASQDQQLARPTGSSQKRSSKRGGPSPPESIETTPTKTNTTKVTPKQAWCSHRSYFLRYTIRTLLLDIPLTVTWILTATTVWLDSVHDAYWQPQMQAMARTPLRAAREVTYSKRMCNATDVTTVNASDLRIDPAWTAAEIAQHQLYHGFSAFAGVLKPNTAASLRQHVQAKSQHLTFNERNTPLLANKHRYTLHLGTEAPEVVEALHELASHAPLHAALDSILASNPAVLELSVISSLAGAVAQDWHSDTSPARSAVLNAQSFQPVYTVFVPLQNTTPRVGPTVVCPGTHYCINNHFSSGGRGFPVTTTPATIATTTTLNYTGETPQWSAGDAVLMNSGSFHHGGVHTNEDPTLDTERVMLVVTFAARRRARAESRQISQGTPYTLRWDMWGHTLQDLLHADTIMRRPWTMLRALGLYKLPGTHITGGSMRMANNDTCFEYSDLVRFLDHGGISWLPQFLQPTKAGIQKDKARHEFYLETLLL